MDFATIQSISDSAFSYMGLFACERAIRIAGSGGGESPASQGSSPTEVQYSTDPSKAFWLSFTNQKEVPSRKKD